MGRRSLSRFLGRTVAVLSIVGVMFGVEGSITVAAVAPHADHQFMIRVDTSRPVIRLYRDGRIYRVYPISLGKPETQSPIGSWRVVDKQRDWGRGFGTRWMGLNVSWGTYGIHGTNQPWSISQYASNGCLRMHNRDVEQLFDLVPINTPVIITGDPLKHLRILTSGNIGADVQLVQQRLRELGYYRGACAGRFDESTEFALMYFQLSRGLPMDGDVDRADYQALALISSGEKPHKTSLMGSL